jgi:hypothetical protein
MDISIAGRIEMNAIDTPASVPSSAARGVILRTERRDKASRHQHEALDEHPRQPGVPSP